MTTQSKSRMISFRLEEEEYNRFRDICFSRGICSVSELARAAVDMLLEQHGRRSPQGTLEARVTELEGQMRMFSLELTRLNQHSNGHIRG